MNARSIAVPSAHPPFTRTASEARDDSVFARAVAALQPYLLEFVMAAASVIVGLLFVAIRGKEDPIAYATAILGLQITATTAVLKHEIHTKLEEYRRDANERAAKLLEGVDGRLRDQLEIYRLAGRVATRWGGKHDIILSQTSAVLDTCRQSLLNLSDGKIGDRAEVVFHLLTDLLGQCQEELFAVHIGRGVQHVAAWKQPHMANYYAENVAAKKRGVRVQRIFVLAHQQVIDPAIQRVDRRVLDVLQQQADDGIEVFVAWDYEVQESNLVQDWVIVDSHYVEYGVEAGGFVTSEWASKQAFLSVNEVKVKQFRAKFKRLKRYAHTYQQWVRANADVVALEPRPS
ncbi:MAG TPA: hypothetical protein VHG91_19600 [Longimicrobium sp.]|nr:hypothetical protein [Longimicrobium sp.]